MAVIQMTFFSQKLMRTVPAVVILPADKWNDKGETAEEGKLYSTLYLLHGVFGSCTDWLYNTRIQQYAEEHDLAVVMPSGENAFYVDQEKMHNLYGEYIGEELINITRRMFPLSQKREDTYIGGLSMGGYGALRNGLKYRNTFGAILVLSAALVTDDAPKRTNDSGLFIESRDYAEAVWGDLAALSDSDMNPKILVRQAKEEGGNLPDIYMACGEEDSLLTVNKEMADFLRGNGLNVRFETGPGGHDWKFWDARIGEAVGWLPAKYTGQGIGSGNVGVFKSP